MYNYVDDAGLQQILTQVYDDISVSGNYQMGRVTTTIASGATVTFPKPFTRVPLVFVTTVKFEETGFQLYSACVVNCTTDKVTIRATYHNRDTHPWNSSATVPVNWIAFSV